MTFGGSTIDLIALLSVYYVHDTISVVIDVFHNYFVDAINTYFVLTPG